MGVDIFMNNDNAIYQNSSLKRKILNIFFSFIFIIGIGIMLYPTISNFYYNMKSSNVIEDYNSYVKEEKIDNKEEILAKAKEYNETKVVYKIEDIFSTNIIYKDQEYDSILNIQDDGLMGYMEIPKIKVKLPIYHGTSDEVLNKGVGHLKGSSFPIGGENTHAVFAGHRGLPSAKLFTDINLLTKGDYIAIHVLDETLMYEIDKIDVVEPNAVSALEVNDDGDYISLVTCTPYAVNTHRLIVRGKRTTNISKEEFNDIKPAIKVSTGFFIFITVGIIIAIILAIFITSEIIKFIIHKRNKSKS